MSDTDLFGVLRTACGDPAISSLTMRQLAMLIACDRMDWLVHVLAEHLGVSVSVISRGADALVRAELMRRWSQPSDKRRVWLGLTPAGKTAVERVSKARLEMERTTHG